MSSFTKVSSSTSCSEEDTEQLRRGPWTLEEDSLLTHYVARHGEGHWNLLAKHAGLRRTGKSCRLRWLNYLKPDVKRGNLTPEEQFLILELHCKWGNRWSKIAQELPGRTDNEIKNYWRTRVQKQARHLKIDANSAAFRNVIRCFWMPRLLQMMKGSSTLPQQVAGLEQQNSDSEQCASSCVSSSESMNNNMSKISEFAEYQTSSFGITDNNEYNTVAKDCYYVDNSSCYGMETINLPSTSAVGDFMTADCHMADNNWMYTSRKKIHKDKDAEPTEFEESIAQAFFDLENTNQDLKSDLKDLYINSAVQIDVSGSRKAVVIHVPYRLRKAFRKVHVKLVRELEKKFSGKDVILIATRRILRPPKKGSAVQRPRSRTLTAVHEAMLEDVVLPAEIVGKRTRYRIDGSKIMKVYLDPKERNNTEYKLETFSAVYRKLAGKDVVFEFPVTEA
ncbi:hypothetical protein PVK06_030555 [Gossypium arboreum]|uniref:Uncharacterized protein n=7 Tax=Gossypium TaxID=3633 RepID=A0ABR0NNL6_GOSAR|nr:hypothetical protein PVK06_030555 [Gossypium arboreum]